MSVILFIKAAAKQIIVFAGGYKFNVATNSMYAPTVAAWPLSPLAVP